MTDNEKAFLVEYEALCRKYCVNVDSCGCCDGPSLGGISEFAENIAKRDGFADYIAQHIAHLGGQ